jgi:hypothetical protein
MKKMKAFVYHKKGSPEKLVYGEIDKTILADI